MIDVLIVDDEYLEGILIEKSFDWEGNGFRIVSTATNGREALDDFVKYNPDLVLTDINMPFMDGLELSAAIKELDRDTEIIIISGFNEFKYAQKGITIGVRSYILKPIDRAELESAVMKAKKLIESAGSKSKHRDVIVESFFQKLINGASDEADFDTEDLGIYATFIERDVVCVNMQKGQSAQEGLDAVKAVCSRLEPEYKYYNFRDYQGNAIFLICLPEDTEKGLNDLKWIFTDINKKAGLSLRIALSEGAAGAEDIAQAYRQTQSVLAIFDVLKIFETASYSTIETLNLKLSSSFQSYLKKFTLYLKNAMKDRALEVLDMYMNDMKASCMADQNAVKTIVFEVTYAISNIMSGLNGSLSDILGEKSVYKTLTNINTFTSAREVLEKCVSNCIEFSAAVYNSKTPDSLSKVIKFIDDNYTNPDLSLKMVASRYYLNESYLSRTFKMNMKKSFVEYIMEKRMEQAITFIKESALKNYQIAEAVGINDPNYFGQCFKKYTGVTVNQFRLQQTH